MAAISPNALLAEMVGIIAEESAEANAIGILIITIAFPEKTPYEVAVSAILNPLE